MFKFIRNLFRKSKYNDVPEMHHVITPTSTVFIPDYYDSQTKFKQKGQFSQKETIYQLFMGKKYAPFLSNYDLFNTKVLGENVPLKSYTRAVNDLLKEGKIVKSCKEKEYYFATKRERTLFCLPENARSE